MKASKFLSVLCLTGAFVVAGLAQTQDANKTKTPKVDKREQNQEKRIEQGVKSGELTGKETKRLEAEQAKIKKDEAAAKSDGKVTKKERRKLAKEQNRASKDIHRLKHNARTNK